MIRFMIDEHRRHPWVLPGIALSASAALGSALPSVITAISGWLA